MYYHQCVVAMDSGSLIQDYMIAQVSSSMKCFNMYICSNSTDSEVVCGDPSSPVNGRVGRPPGSGLGSTVSFQCSEGLSPPWLMNSTNDTCRVLAKNFDLGKAQLLLKIIFLEPYPLSQPHPLLHITI